jgi:hypothetical protein
MFVQGYKFAKTGEFPINDLDNIPQQDNNI